MGRQRHATDVPSAVLSDGTLARIVPSAFAGGFELQVGETPQSHVDLADPTHLHFEYVARIGAVIDQLRPGPITAVHLGGGALTLPRYIAGTRPGSRQQVIELEPALVDLVREHLPWQKDAGIRVRIADARAALTKLPLAIRGRVDLVVSDVFRDATTPAHVTSVEFFREVRTLLAKGGLVAVNVADGAGLRFARRQVATVRDVFEHVAVLAEVQVLKGRRFGNLVIVGSGEPLPSGWLPRLMAAGPHPAKVAEGREIETLIAGASPVTDRDATASPRPTSALFDRS